VPSVGAELQNLFHVARFFNYTNMSVNITPLTEGFTCKNKVIAIFLIVKLGNCHIFTSKNYVIAISLLVKTR